MQIRIEGLNLEKLLRASTENGIHLRDVRRTDARTIEAYVRPADKRTLLEICARSGWKTQETEAGWVLKFLRFLRMRPMFFAGMALWLGLLFVSSRMIWRVRIEHASENIGEIRRYLAQVGAQAGSLQSLHATDKLRDALALRVPGLSYVGVRYAGSTLIVDCMPAREGEKLDTDGTSRDLYAIQDGIVTEIVVRDGTPVVKPGDAVRKGQILIRGEEKHSQEEPTAVIAQGSVMARIWSRGDAKSSLTRKEMIPTGNTRQRRTLYTPWSERVTEEANPFDLQVCEKARTKLVGLYLPVYWLTETFFEQKEEKKQIAKEDAISLAQGAAEKIAKNKCPPGTIILDKCVNYSMIDNEFMYATVVLEYEQDIAARMQVQ